jgi:Rrf2 family transcriptional regulator, iron-sulfur cluster assembly transcription factor
MMKLTTKGRYGLRAMVDLALNQGDGAVCIQCIAERQNISDTYLEQLFRKLKKSGLVKSVRGAGGGYVLARPEEDISVGDVLISLEGGLNAVECKGSEDNEECGMSDLCVTKIVWQRINESIKDAVNTISIKDLADRSRELRKKGQVATEACSNQNQAEE